jgi:hypothetical protein
VLPRCVSPSRATNPATVGLLALVSTVRVAIGRALPGFHFGSAFERAALCGRDRSAFILPGDGITAETPPAAFSVIDARVRIGNAGATEQTTSNVANRPITGLRHAGYCNWGDWVYERDA